MSVLYFVASPLFLLSIFLRDSYPRHVAKSPPPLRTIVRRFQKNEGVSLGPYTYVCIVCMSCMNGGSERGL